MSIPWYGIYTNTASTVEKQITPFNFIFSLYYKIIVITFEYGISLNVI